MEMYIFKLSFGLEIEIIEINYFKNGWGCFSLEDFF